MSWWRGLRSSQGSDIRHEAWRFKVGVCLFGLLFVSMVFNGFSDDTPKPQPTVRRLGVVSFYNPRLLYAKYQKLVDYLTEATGEHWELDLSLNYQETDQAFCSGKLDAAYLGPFTFLRVREACGAVPVLRLNTKGSASYRSLIMVRRDSPYQGLSDLKGTVFAFGSPLSTSSHLVPRMMLQDAGLKPGEDIHCRYFGHHDRAARAVVLGTADACGVRDIVGERFARRGLRVLARSEAIPNFPLVVRPEAPEAFRRSLIKVLVEAPAHNPDLRKRMESWDEEIAEGFAPASEADYQPVQHLVELVFGKRGLIDPPELLECGSGK